jgi:hypothetical protein
MRTLRVVLAGIAFAVAVTMGKAAQTGSGEASALTTRNANSNHGGSSDSLIADSVALAAAHESQDTRTLWGLDILLSNNGFGLGAFYRREFTEDLSGFLTLSVSESKDEREVEQYDYFGNVFVPGKLSRFLVVPLMVGIQYRLFREDITDSFRPYVNAGAGPTLIYASPFAEIIPQQPSGFELRQVDFFKSLGKGQPHYTAGAFVGIGASFGSEKSNVVGVNLRYYFTYLFGDGLPSLYDIYTGEVVGTKKEFGGFFITFNIGFSN